MADIYEFNWAEPDEVPMDNINPAQPHQPNQPNNKDDDSWLYFLAKLMVSGVAVCFGAWVYLMILNTYVTAVYKGLLLFNGTKFGREAEIKPEDLPPPSTVVYEAIENNTDLKNFFATVAFFIWWSWNHITWIILHFMP